VTKQTTFASTTSCPGFPSCTLTTNAADFSTIITIPNLGTPTSITINNLKFEGASSENNRDYEIFVVLHHSEIVIGHSFLLVKMLDNSGECSNIYLSMINRMQTTNYDYMSFLNIVIDTPNVADKIISIYS
jgi:hypothetical protein